ncbi:MAG: leucine-rich repeat domain-containing protein, partial [Clostridia bacterium]|nr:leucine-rich repeat domain-containing protein [Clostridia bacterium]
MKKLSKIFPIIVIILCLTFALVACTPADEEPTQNNNEIVDEGGNDNSSNNGGGNNNLKPSPAGPLAPAKNVFVFEKIAGVEEYALKSVNIVNKEVVIPSLYNDKPVTAILTQAFYSNEVVEEVSIPDTITTIGARAFSLCVNLKKVHISAYSELSEIGERAFFACDRLEEIYLPQTLVKVGTEAFSGCVDLVTLNFPNSLYEVGEGAFDCGWLDSLSEDGVVYVGNVAYAFRYTASTPIAQDITIKDGSTAVASKAFYGEEWISSISIPSSVTRIGALALNNTQRLQNISVSEDNAVYSSLGNSLVEKANDTLLASSLNTIVSQGVKVIGEEAFAYSNLTEISLPESVTSICPGAFKQSKIVSV